MSYARLLRPHDTQLTTTPQLRAPPQLVHAGVGSGGIMTLAAMGAGLILGTAGKALIKA